MELEKSGLGWYGRREVEVVSWNEMGVDEMAGKLQEVMISACDKRVERTRGTERQVRRKGRNWIRYRGDAERQMLRVSLARYKKRIWERKREVWEL